MQLTPFFATLISCPTSFLFLFSIFSLVLGHEFINWEINLPSQTPPCLVTKDLENFRFHREVYAINVDG
jgi:hypothetical protein